LDKDKFFVIDLPRINWRVNCSINTKLFLMAAGKLEIFTWSPELDGLYKALMYPRGAGDWRQHFGGNVFHLWYQTLRWDEPYIYPATSNLPAVFLAPVLDGIT
jgi:hypothetical protein